MQHSVRNRIERGEHIAPSSRICLKAQKRHGAVIEEVFEVLDGRGVRQIALVVLKDDGQAVYGAVIEAEIGLEALKGLQIIPLAVHLRVDDKDDRICLAQDELKRGIVGHLAGHSIEVKGGLVAWDGISLHAEEVEKQRAILRSGEGHEIAAATRIELRVDLLDVRGLPA